MAYHVSFDTHVAEGARTYTWFVFDDDGTTLRAGFQSKEAALAWAGREFGLRYV